MLTSNDLLGKPVIPGDSFETECASAEVECPVRIGPGLQFISRKDNKTDTENPARSVYAVRSAGVLRCSVNNEDVFYVNPSSSYIYEPSVGDIVVGLVVGRTIDYYRVAIRSRELAFLGQLAFEGATKRNRPEVQIGDVVMARVSAVSPGVVGRQAELICYNPSTDKAEGMGVLKDPKVTSSNQGSPGVVFTLPTLPQIQRILNPKNKLVKAVGERFPFEGAYGYNGVIWVRARSVKETVLVSNLLETFSMSKSPDKEWANRFLDAASNRLAGLV